jgi:ribosomal protein S18 acetylase RimI-like enzyme
LHGYLYPGDFIAMTISIRPATLDDYEAFNDLTRQIDQQHIAAYPELFQAVEPPRSLELVQSYIEAEEKYLWLATQADQVAGLILFELQQSGDFPLLVPRRFVLIDMLVVDSAFRRQGIGRALMTAVHDWGTAQGIDHFELSVYKLNPEAQAFYERMGYAVKTMRRWRK